MEGAPTSGSVLKTLGIVYLAILLVVVIFSLFVFYQIYSGSITPTADPEFIMVFRYALLALTPMGVAGGYFFFKALINSIPKSARLRQKIGRYQVAFLVRTACLEAPGLLGAICAMLSGDLSFLLFTAIVVVLMAMLRPSVAAITIDLELSPEESARLNNPDAIMD